MQHFEFQWQTPDGLQIFAQGWRPKSAIKAVVCLVHGQGEHSGRYSHVATVLNQAGYVLLGLDLRGNGKSEGKRGHASSYETLMDDIAHLTDEAAKRFPDYPRFLYGHCMGGNLVLNYILRRRPQLVGVIATSPLLSLSFELHTCKVMLARIIANVWPSLCFTMRIDVAMISRDPEVLQTLENDPLCHTRISARMLISAFFRLAEGFTPSFSTAKMTILSPFTG